MANPLTQQLVPLFQTRQGIEKHWKLLLHDLHPYLPRSGGQYTWLPSSFQGIQGDISCAVFRALVTPRERGGNAPIVPLLDGSTGGPEYWMSLHQEWREVPQGRSTKFIYYTTSITVYFGSPDVVDKHQLFRAEWPGVRISQTGDFVFEALGAGHPHWQFDAFQGQVEAERQRLAELSRILSENYEVEEFSESVVTQILDESAVKATQVIQRLGQLHFASYADWAVNPWNGDLTATGGHARGPADTRQIANWTLSTLAYVRQELGRLQ